MTYDESKEIVTRMVKDAESNYNGNPAYSSAYTLGSLEAKIQFLLTQSNLKFKNFDEKGNYKLPS